MMFADAEPTSLEHLSDAAQAGTVAVMGVVIVGALFVYGVASWAAAWWRWLEEELEEWTP
jgi:hypothetical protein